MDTSSFSRDRSCTFRLPSQYVHSNRGCGSGRAASLRPPSRCILFGASCCLDNGALSSLFISRLQPRYIPPQRRQSWSGGQETRNVRCLRPARPCFSVYCMCMLSTRYSVVFAWYMALVEPRNGGTKTLCKRLSPGKQEIMIFIDNVPPPFYTPRSSKILGRTFLTRIYMTTASLRLVLFVLL